MVPLDLASELIARYRIRALSGLLDGARAAAREDGIAIAVVGRFKAGKSSFLNHFLGRQVLPTGVVPVTSVITEIRYGARAAARVRWRDGSESPIPLAQIASCISEKENPGNRRQVDSLTIELPELDRFRGLRFVDTPGLESALAHNTETALSWLPHTGLALVAVSVDPPLSVRDIELLRSLAAYTPRVALLLTKIDLLSEDELPEVLEFVGAQLTKHFASPPRVLPYSTRPGWERFRQALETEFVDGILLRLDTERDAIAARKAHTLLTECAAYLTLALRAAEVEETERRTLAAQAAGETEALADLRSATCLLVRQAVAEARAVIAGRLEKHQQAVDRALSAAFEAEFPKWTGGLADVLAQFEIWAARALGEELAAVSLAERPSLLAPLDRVAAQTGRALQQFREQLSGRTERAFGVPLHTTEVEIRAEEPASPDIRVGRVFDRNWELLSPLLPMRLIRAAVRRHFAHTLSYLIYENLSRLAAQWEESLASALRGVEKEAQRRLEELLGTVRELVEGSSRERAAEIRADLQRTAAAREMLPGN